MRKLVKPLPHKLLAGHDPFLPLCDCPHAGPTVAKPVAAPITLGPRAALIRLWPVARQCYGLSYLVVKRYAVLVASNLSLPFDHRFLGLTYLPRKWADRFSPKRSIKNRLPDGLS